MPTDNLEMLQTVANGLGDLIDEIVFVGGAGSETNYWYRDRNKSQPITRMVWVIAFRSPDNSVIISKSQ